MAVNTFSWRGVEFILALYLVKMMWVCHLA